MKTTLYYKVLHVKIVVSVKPQYARGAGASQDPLGGRNWTVSRYVQFAEICDSFRERRLAG